MHMMPGCPTYYHINLNPSQLSLSLQNAPTKTQLSTSHLQIIIHISWASPLPPPEDSFPVLLFTCLFVSDINGRAAFPLSAHNSPYPTSLTLSLAFSASLLPAPLLPHVQLSSLLLIISLTSHLLRSAGH